MKTKVAVIGASGYTGGELVRLLLGHPCVEITALTARGEQKKMGDLFHCLDDKKLPLVEPLDVKKVCLASEVIFLALPHKVSMGIAPLFIENKKKVIDMSADYRFGSAEIYEKWYKVEHTSKTLLKKAVYGLPELYREKIADASLLANPGCYPTSAILSILPLLSSDCVFTDNIIVDALSGVSGAGKNAGADGLFCRCNENLKAYKIAAHRHQPEIEEALSGFTKGSVDVTLSPHLVSINRGIMTTTYLKLKKKQSKDELLKLFLDFYAQEPFVSITTGEAFPEIRDVCGTNTCKIGVTTDEMKDKAIVVSVIDNLIKGAAGQAIQNINIMCGFDEGEGLTTTGFPV